MSSHTLDNILAEARKRPEPLVLATVVETRGSTYRKAGARMLISKDLCVAGIVSGGCFDADLVERSRTVIETGQPALHTYDMRSPDDAIWGLGLGCEGAATIVFQQADELLLDVLAKVANQGGWLATDLTLDQSGSAGMTQAVDGPIHSPGVQEIDGRRVFIEQVNEPPRLLIFGAGVDAVPVARFACQLGYRVDVVDFRPANLVPERFAQCRLISEEDWYPGPYDGAILMSHNLAADERFLKVIWPEDIPYIGLLGPTHRRERLIQSLENSDEAQLGRIRGPAGLDLGGELPEEIALSMLAELQMFRYRANGLPWTGQNRK